MALFSSSVAAQGVYLSPLRLNSSGQTTLTADYSRSVFGGSAKKRSLAQRHNFNLSGVSQGFVWKPWFSRLSLRFGSTVNYRQSYSNSERSGGASDSWSVSNRLNARLSVLPGTRIPFNLSLDASQIITDQGAESWLYGLHIRQGFTPLFRRSLVFDGSYDLDLQAASTSHDFSLGVRDQIGLHSVDGTFSWQKTQDGRGSSGNGSYSIVGNHSVPLVARGVTISNFASRIDSQQDSGNGAVVNQFYNVVSWLPYQYQGLLDYRGTSRVTASELRAAGEVSTLTQLVHNSALTYRITPNLRLRAAVGLADAGGGVFLDESAGLSYSAPESSDWGGWTRRWGAGGSVSFAQSEQANNESASASFDQSLGRDLISQGLTRARLDFSQSVSSELYSDGFDPIYTLSHSAALYRTGVADESNSSWQMTASDTREIDGSDAESQLLRSDYRHNDFSWGDGAFSSKFNAELLRNRDSDQAVSVAVSLETIVSYSQSAVFAIPRLNYIAEGRLDWAKNIKAAEGGSEEAKLTWRMSNQLSWAWGLLSASGSLNVSGTPDSADLALRFEVRRYWRPLN